jgi:hypothetical protein
MPKTMPTPCIDRARRVSTRDRTLKRKFLVRNNLSNSVAIAIPTAKLFILFVILVRDQEVGGSNPLAPTTLCSTAYTLSPPEKVVGILRAPANES